MAISRVSQSTVKEGLEKSTSFFAGIPPILGRFESIQTITVGSGGAASIELTSIPSTYQHLQIRLIGRTNRTQARESMDFRLNGVTSSSYAYHFIYGDGSSVSAGAGASQTLIDSFDFAGATATASIFGAAIIDILDYAVTSKNKTVRVFGGADRNGAGLVALSSGLLTSTDAVTSVTIFPANGNNFVQYSTAALYGIRS